MPSTKFIPTFIFLFSTIFANAQFEYEASTAYPYGRPNPNAPSQIKDFAPLIGICDCKSYSRNTFPDSTWKKPVDMIWKFKYIMNGRAIQDETIKTNGFHSGSIRQYNADSSTWYVHFYSTSAPPANLPSWEGNKNKQGDIVLYNEQKSPNGMDGYYKITFYNISTAGFQWLGEWVSTDEKIRYATWKIDCKKRR